MKSFIALLLTSAVILSCSEPTIKETLSSIKKTKPLNILYIMADDHAYQAISAYGSEISKSLNHKH